MWDFIKNILQAFWDTWSQMAIAFFTMRFYNKRIMNPNSIWYYKSVNEKIKLRLFTIKITLVILLFNVLRVFGFKPNKESTDKAFIAVVIIIAALAIIAMTKADKKRSVEIA